jgi:hypothetical protein
MPSQLEWGVEVKTSNRDVELVGQCDPYGESGSITVGVVHYDWLVGSEEIFCDAETSVSGFKEVLIDVLVSGGEMTSEKCGFPRCPRIISIGLGSGNGGLTVARRIRLALPLCERSKCSKAQRAGLG